VEAAERESGRKGKWQKGKVAAHYRTTLPRHFASSEAAQEWLKKIPFTISFNLALSYDTADYFSIVPHQLARHGGSTSPELAGCNNSQNEVQEQGKSSAQRVKSAVLD
jgi:hypothetical protein